MPERKAIDFSPHHATKGGSPPRQTTLDQFETTKPLVKKLESLKEPREPQKRKRLPLEEIGNRTGSKAPSLQRKEPIIIGSSPSASSASSHGSPAAKHRPLRSSSNDDRLDAPSIETKRRRLLEMDDWMGLDRPSMKPVKMKFADPADTDLIGKRRRISITNHRLPSDRKWPVTREAIPVRRLHETSKATAQYYPEEDISVRIGSAGDRSDGRASLKDNSRLSVLSDELLDGEPRLAHELQPSAPVFNTPGPAPIRLSDHAHREVLTPPAYMNKSSSPVRTSNRVDHLHRHRQASSPAGIAEKFTSNGMDELREWALPSEEQEQAQEEPSFRVVFRKTPRPHAQRVRGLGSSPFVRNFAFAEARTTRHPLELPAASPASKRVTSNGVEFHNVKNPELARGDHDKRAIDPRAVGLADVVPQLVTAASEDPVFDGVDNHPIHSDPKVETVAITTLPSVMASAQILTEFQTCIASNARLEDGITRTLQDMEKRFAQETGKTPPATMPRHHLQAIDRPGQLQHYQLQDASEAGASMRDLTKPDPAEGKTSLPQAPLQAATTISGQQRPAEPSVTTNGRSQVSLPATKEKESLEAAEDEEAAWRKIVFGDDQDSNIHTFEEPEAPSQASSSPYHPLLIQPSLLAEAATSPLKQNPHLADSTFDASTSTATSRSPSQTHAVNSPTKDFTSIPPPLPPSISTNPPIPILPILPRTLVQNPITSSLQGEASSPPHQPLPLTNISSDELQRPPERLPDFPSKRHRNDQNQEPRALENPQEQRPSGTQTRSHSGITRKEKVVFKKPTRYIGSHSSNAATPVVLGERVLRSGRRVGGTGGKGAREKMMAKGKSRLAEREHGQNVMGNDDDIVDD